MRLDFNLAIGVLNGALGDYLARTENGLATAMTFVRAARPLEPADLADEVAGQRVAVLVHGLMSTESVWDFPDGKTYGSLLEEDLQVKPVYVRYNSGLHISKNGALFDQLMCKLFATAVPQPREVILIGHSMGGLVVRAATHSASQSTSSPWLERTTKAIYIGSPHLGTPLERTGNVLTWGLRKAGVLTNEPIPRLLGDIAALRSSGIKDLRYGNVAEHDWHEVDPDELLRNRRHPAPLLESIRHLLIAGTLDLPAATQPWLAALLGDALVPVRSATGRAREADRAPLFPQENVNIVAGTSHLALAHHPQVYGVLKAWCSS